MKPKVHPPERRTSIYGENLTWEINGITQNEAIQLQEDIRKKMDHLFKESPLCGIRVPARGEAVFFEVDENTAIEDKNVELINSEIRKLVQELDKSFLREEGNDDDNHFYDNQAA